MWREARDWFGGCKRKVVRQTLDVKGPGSPSSFLGEREGGFDLVDGGAGGGGASVKRERSVDLNRDDDLAGGTFAVFSGGETGGGGAEGVDGDLEGADLVGGLAVPRGVAEFAGQVDGLLEEGVGALGFRGLPGVAELRGAHDEGAEVGRRGHAGLLGDRGEGVAGCDAGADF